MNLRIKSPKIANKAASNVITKKVTKELDGDCHIRFTEAEIGMKDGKVYAKFALEGEMEKNDFIKLLKMAMEGS